MTDLYLPQELKSMIQNQAYSVDNVGMSDSKVLIFEDKVLKIQPETVETQTEHVMMNWLAGQLPVPQILFHAVEDGISYLLMSKIDGKMSCDEEYIQDSKRLTGILAESLKRLWQVDISDCPVRWDLQHKLPVARKAVDTGVVDMENAEPETYGEGGFQDPAELMDWLYANQPGEDLVLSHGDFCLPNIFLKKNGLSGFIDLGRMGVADRWQDIALCYRSLKHNYSGKYSGKTYGGYDPDFLFEALDMDPDWQKINYYILLDELF